MAEQSKPRLGRIERLDQLSRSCSRVIGTIVEMNNRIKNGNSDPNSQDMESALADVLLSVRTMAAMQELDILEIERMATSPEHLMALKAASRYWLEA